MKELAFHSIRARHLNFRASMTIWQHCVPKQPCSGHMAAKKSGVKQTKQNKFTLKQSTYFLKHAESKNRKEISDSQ